MLASSPSIPKTAKQGCLVNLACFSVILSIIFSVTGYGHGVGMSQTGADSMAKTGANYETIIKHFYTGVEIIELKFL